MEKLESRRKGNSYRNQSIILIVIGIISLFGVFVFPLLIIISIIFFAIGGYLWQKQTLWNIGADGEEAVMRVLKELDSSFRVIHDVVLPGDRQNIDHIVVGISGTFVIETKNHNGQIKCYDDTWYRNKIGRQGTRYEASIGNPSKQAKRNAVVLKNWLQSKNIDPGFISAVVVFTNDDVTLKLVRPTVKVVTIENLLPVFNSQTGRLTQDKVNSIAEKLYKLKQT